MEKVSRRSFLFSFLCVPFVSAWRKIAPVKKKVLITYGDIHPGGYCMNDSMTVDDYMALYEETLLRMYDSPFHELASKMADNGRRTIAREMTRINRSVRYPRLMSGGTKCT